MSAFTRCWRALLILASISALLGTVAAGGASPVRALLAIWVLSVCPGLAVLGLARLGDPLMETTLVLGLSVALDVIVAGVLTYTIGWRPDLALVILLAFSLGGAALQAAAPVRRGVGA